MELIRTYFNYYTKGIMLLPDGVTLEVLELPWKGNAIGKSCIPEGEYTVDRDMTSKHQWFRFRNDEVSPRTHIEIHPAVKLKHLQGCLAPCEKIVGGAHSKNPTAINSHAACELLLDWFPENSFVLNIKSTTINKPT